MLVGGLIILIACLITTLIIVERGREHAWNSALAADERARTSDQNAADLVLAVSPLIEQTDWMTGRWGGQFNTLVSMEKARNAHVVEARTVLWRFPVVRDTILTYGALPGKIDLNATTPDRIHG